MGVAVTRIRDPVVFGVSLLLLVGAGALGLVLRHDGELGTTGSVALETGTDTVRLKGDLVPFQPPASSSWESVREVLSNSTLWLQDSDVGLVLVTGVEDHAAGEDRIVQGLVVYRGVHPDDPSVDLLVVEAESVYEPYFEW